VGEWRLRTLKRVAQLLQVGAAWAAVPRAAVPRAAVPRAAAVHPVVGLRTAEAVRQAAGQRTAPAAAPAAAAAPDRRRQALRVGPSRCCPDQPAAPPGSLSSRPWAWAPPCRSRRIGRLLIE
jgi:hypothetical protein